ncbi:DUF6733 family protein [Eisenibacter elegans]|jgi:hypothetical protein|uniref:DUF6733 family protein n=1 Tax=Eisenibacter elegans TaxID=997 RepID=UPI000411E30E|nr:DUF6733 family protein [Eisenibacter elegans]
MKKTTIYAANGLLSATLWRTVLVFGLASLLLSAPLRAQEEDSKVSLNISLNSDIFFGFYPFFSGAYKGSSVDFTFYGILWSGGAAGGSWGNWTEFGIGIGIPVGDALYINPQVGLLNGSLTSGLGTPVLAEGLVPNLTVGLGTDALEGELYGGYYMGLDHGNPTTNNYLHYWINGGYKISSFLSLGLHFEQLRFTGGKDEGPAREAFDFYQALGPYIQFSAPKLGAFARFSSGFDLRSDAEVAKSSFEQPSFFKLSVGFGF